MLKSDAAGIASSLMFILMNLRQVELEGKFFLFSYVVAHKNNNIIFKAQNH